MIYKVADSSTLMVENNLGFDDQTACREVIKVADRRFCWRITIYGCRQAIDVKRYFEER